MRIPIDISYRNIDKSDALDSLIKEKAEKLERFSESLVSCRVAVECPHESQVACSEVLVRLVLAIPPAKDLVVQRTSSDGELRDILPTLIRDVFRVAGRKIVDMREKQRG